MALSFVLVYVSVVMYAVLTFFMGRLACTRLLEYVLNFSSEVEFMMWFGLVWIMRETVFYDPRFDTQADTFGRLLLCCIIVEMGIFMKKVVLHVLHKRFMSRSFRDRIVDSSFRCYVVDQLVAKARQETRTPSFASSTTSMPAEDDDEDGASSSTPAFYDYLPFRACMSRFRGNGAEHRPFISSISLPLLHYKLFSENLNIRRLMENDYGEAEGVPRSSKEAKLIAANTFSFLAKTNPNSLVMSDFEAVFGSKEFAKDAFYVFSVNDDEFISKGEFRSVILDIYKDKRNIDKSISLSFQALDKLEGVIEVVVYFGVFIVCLNVFGSFPASILTISLSSLLTLGVIFGNATRNAIDGIIFLFATHAFDIGDCVLISDKRYVVHEMNIFSTVFRGWEGEEIYYPNTQLAAGHVTNLTRNSEQYEAYRVSFPAKLTGKQIILFRKGLYKHLAEHPADYFTMYEFDTASINAAKLDEVLLRVKCKVVSDQRRVMDRKVQLNEFLQNLVKDVCSGKISN